MQINIKTSEANKVIVRKLTDKLPVGTKKNVIARIALGYSLQIDRKFSSSEFDLYDSKGQEYKDNTLFDAKYRDFFIALICQHYGIYKTDENIPKYIKLHIDHGLEEMDNLFSNSNNYTFFDFMIDRLDRGISSLESATVSLNAVRNKNQNIEKTYFGERIKINIGKKLNSDEEVYLEFNAKSYNNNHIAVAGKTGVGKTQFALELLNQISEKSNHLVNFIYLDFKGVKGGDLKQLQPFLSKTKSKFIDVPNTPFPVNPLSFIDNINENDKKGGMINLWILFVNILILV